MASGKRKANAHGILIVDKGPGLTSHDVVAMARRAFGQRQVGHTGTLDPMATGVLVLVLGEATKLVSYLVSDNKEYRTTVRLGMLTDSLDADGTVTEEAPVPRELSRERVAEAAAKFIGTHPQRAPAVSALKVAGKPLYARVRQGEQVEAPVREVTVDELEVEQVDLPDLRLRVACGKGFYVRALGRDLAADLGTLGTLTALRRLRNGPWTSNHGVTSDCLLRAARGDEASRQELMAALLSPEQAWGDRHRALLSAAGEAKARVGKVVPLGDVSMATAPDDGQCIALLTETRELVAIARRDGDALKVVRGFNPCH